MSDDDYIIRLFDQILVLRKENKRLQELLFEALADKPNEEKSHFNDFESSFKENTLDES